MESFSRQRRSTISEALATEIMNNFGEREMDDLYSMDYLSSESSDFNEDENMTTPERSENSKNSDCEEKEKIAAKR